MTKPRILATKSLDRAIESLFSERFEFHIAKDASIESIAEAAQRLDPQGMVVRDDLPDTIAELAPSLVHIARHGSGVDVIPVKACSDAGICISRVPGGNAVSVAEWCLSQILSLLHRLPDIVEASRNEGWSIARKRFTGAAVDLAEKKVLILGFGAIAQHLSHMLCIGLRAKVTIACRRPEAFKAEHASLEFISMSEALAALPQTEVLVPCIALSASTEGLVSQSWFDALPARAIVVNASRGEVLDEQAMCKALVEGRLAGAAIDVVASRSLASDSPLWQTPRLVITPHLAGHTADAHQRNGMSCLEALTESLLLNQCPKHAINPEVWPQALERMRN